jgi:DNA-binding PadR family transcriptional regulator
MSSRVQPELTPTARVVLGFLSLGARTGYDIKAFAERSVRFFWGASFGQIYPELKRLERAGLIASSHEPRGGLRRTEYELTDAGRAALHAWLTSSASLLFQYRDEGLLKVFFGELMEHEELLRHVRQMRDEFAADLAVFRGLQDEAPRDAPFPLLALDYGIAFLEFAVRWWTETEQRLRASRPRRGRPRGT